MSIIKGKRMLQVLMYHHVNSNSYTNSLEIIDRHFKSLKKNCVSLFPGETICNNSICLTFDDGYGTDYTLTVYKDHITILGADGTALQSNLPLQY